MAESEKEIQLSEEETAATETAAVGEAEAVEDNRPEAAEDTTAESVEPAEHTREDIAETDDGEVPEAGGNAEPDEAVEEAASQEVSD